MDFKISQDVVWWRGATRGRLTAISATVLSQRDQRVQILLDDGAKRWVDFRRIQPVRWLYHSWPTPDYIFFEDPVSGWGECTVYSEINKDLFPNRSVYSFENGKFLCYSREHWFDYYGALGTLPFCEFRWIEFWGALNEITKSEFDLFWENAIQPDPDVDELAREMPHELVELEPWTRNPIHIGG